jgi:MFS transporter, YNFM family, putative membrane transport protein
MTSSAIAVPGAVCAARAESSAGVRGVVAVLCAAAISTVSTLHLIVPLLAGIADRYAVSSGAAAWAGTGFALAFAAGSLVLPTLSDRYDRRHVMAAGLIAAAAAALVAGLSSDFAWLVIARVAQGFAAAAVPTVAMAYVSEALPAALRAGALAKLSACFLLAGIAGQAYALGVEAVLGWRWVFLALVPLLLACAAAVARLPASSRAGRAPGLMATFRNLARLVRRPPVLVAYACALPLLLTFVGMYGALNGVAAERYAITGSGALLLVRLAGLPGIAAGLLGGSLVARLGPHRAGAIALMVAAGGLATEALAGPLWLLLAGSAVYVGGVAAAVPAIVTVVGMGSGEARGAGIAGYGALIALGAAIAPLALDWLDGWTFATLCGAMAALLLIVGGLLAVGPRPAAALSASR